MLKSIVNTAWPKRLLTMLTCAVGFAAFLRSDDVVAQTCGTEHTIKEGETLAQIAARIYGNPTQWTMIFYANQDRLGGNISMLVPGLSLRLPCLGGTQTTPAPAPAAAVAPAPSADPAVAVAPPGSEPQFVISSLLHRVEFLTADGFAPYTGRSLEGGGMLTQIISSAMQLVKDESKGRFDYGISWVNDWAAHLNPLLLTRAFDVGFPWARPDCEGAATLDQSSQFRCQRFFFSDPLYEVLTGLFVRNNSKVKSLRREEISGMTLCRPAGYPVHELDQDGRNWVKDRIVTLIRPPSVDECFRLLDTGAVDGVVEAELAGRASITSLGLTGKVRMLDQPVALTTYHALVSKSHPHARTILYYINSALEKLRERGEYDRIIERHLGRFWEAQVTPNATLGNTPASSDKSVTPSTPPETEAPSALASGNDPKAKTDSASKIDSAKKSP
ncbi:MAG: transporter substrate-binding domain-containing protein [Hyphomicrobiaceae bacterium]|nr:transporter substrate-binding domain-containing protein [Hyphomicrobiaceae bacterium]